MIAGGLPLRTTRIPSLGKPTVVKAGMAVGAVDTGADLATKPFGWMIWNVVPGGMSIHKRLM